MSGAERREVEQAAAGLAGLYTEPVLDQAAALLADLYAAGDRHGVAPSEWGGVTHLPQACVMVAHPRYRDTAPQTGEQAAALLDELAAALTARGVPATRDGLQVTLARDCAAGLSITIVHRSGWALISGAAHSGPVITIYATHDADGAAAVADAVIAVARGQRLDPLSRR
ncbi:MAG: hypothetical protein GEV09_11055 [Pseudonocardiaceae bacterium]|nr:hypothetical protein [Pseudonocardiaceae bacterium]